MLPKTMADHINIRLKLARVSSVIVVELGL